MKKSVVLYPGVGVGHLVPMVEVAKLFLKHGLAVTVVLIDPQIFRLLKSMNAPLLDFLRSLPSVDALVLDMFCVDAQDVAAELKLPVYYFYASAAADLALFLNLPSMLAGSKSLETRAVRALEDGLCVPGRATPPVYCIGPLVSGGGDQEHECLRWLDAQPDQSVVFLSFGSMGTFSVQQLQEIANGLGKSGERFLWVVRSPRNPDYKYGDSLPEPDLDALMPEGFLERTKDRGLVIKSWAPQVTPTPGPRERVVFIPHFLRGLGFALHPFVRSLVFYYGLDFHDLAPNSFLHIPAFIPAFIRVPPHFDLWLKIFNVKPKVVDGQ
ncbi:Anthocyanidin 5,3-O-glucosyltransferase [Triticum urartu]|uniref:Anthocyanidin 5,3-O-glucosyltransferase n=1 Tax=Triticum urartu TaxID=4572 RepID=M8A435_TRIUA|nr:Anthocyanidin 5,3-O-glucosyltransferase [Triticum urartu]